MISVKPAKESYSSHSHMENHEQMQDSEFETNTFDLLTNPSDELMGKQYPMERWMYHLSQVALGILGN